MKTQADSALSVGSKTVTVYDASGRDRISTRAWVVMFRELREYRELIQQLVLRNFSAQFRQSFLGYLWVALPPVATTVVFALLRQAQVINVPMPADAMPYALFALVGATVWGFFTQVTMTTTTSIANAGSLVSKIYFPREVLVLSAAGHAVVNMLIRLGVLVLSFCLFFYTPHWQVVFAPLLLLPILVLGIGLGFFFAPLNTMMNDVGRMLEFLFQFGMFLAPTVYPTPALSSVTSGWQWALHWIHTLNPVSHYLYAVHSLIETGTFQLTAGLQVSTILSFLILLLGWRFFHICEPFLAERL
jgi:lipopolysaccharide transport system permease protein